VRNQKKKQKADLCQNKHHKSGVEVLRRKSVDLPAKTVVRIKARVKIDKSGFEKGLKVGGL
jgi:hypothetical protein